MVVSGSKKKKLKNDKVSIVSFCISNYCWKIVSRFFKSARIEVNLS
jgi:hypothetical protein